MDWSKKVKLGHLSRPEVWATLHTTISVKIKYPLPACTLSKTECKSITYPALIRGPPKYGICHTMTSTIRDGPVSSGGTGISTLFYLQGASRTAKIVIKVYNWIFLQICIEDLVTEVGMYN